MDGFAFYEIFTRLCLNKQQEWKVFSEMIASFFIRTRNSQNEFTSYLPSEHDDQNLVLRCFKLRTEDYMMNIIEGEETPTSQSVFDSLQFLEEEQKKKMMSDLYQLLLPLSGFDLFDLFVNKTLTPKVNETRRTPQPPNPATPKRTLEQVTNPANQEKDPKMMKNTPCSSSKEPNGSSSEPRSVGADSPSSRTSQSNNSVVMLGKQNSSSTLTHLKPRNSTSSMEQAPMQLSQNEEEDYEEEEIDSEGDEYSDCSDEEKCDETSTTKSNRPTRKAKEQGSIKTKMFIQGLESDEI